MQGKITIKRDGQSILKLTKESIVAISLNYKICSVLIERYKKAMIRKFTQQEVFSPKTEVGKFITDLEAF